MNERPLPPPSRRTPSRTGRGDIALPALALLVPLEIAILEQQVETEGMSVDRIVAGWEDLVDRIISRRTGT